MAVCSFDGNADMYGLGIRIGFYLQWFSGIMSSFLAPSEVEGLRFSNTFFIAATFLALLILTIQDVSSLHIVEVYIILLLTFGYFLFLVPLYLWRILIMSNANYDPTRWPRVKASGTYSVLSFLLLIAVASYQLWFWFARVPDLNGQDCEEFGFFFARVRLNTKWFEILNIVFYFLLLLNSFVMLSIRALVDWFKKVEREELPQLTYLAFTLTTNGTHADRLTALNAEKLFDPHKGPLT
jgi:hypothetical protein